MQEPEIIFEELNAVGVITLNRPQALNALTPYMVHELDQMLLQWEQSPEIKVVIIRGAGDRAFCSGGDIKAAAMDSLAYRQGTSTGQLAKDFFREEYTLNYRIHKFSKPYIALVDGIVMGGGKGVSAHGSHRIVTEKTLFAMPETSIGFFPDVGGGYFLPRCAGQTGLYLALTSKRIQAADTLYIGFATHFVPFEKLASLYESLIQHPWDDSKNLHTQATALIEKFAAPVTGESELALHRDKIDRCFSHNRIEDIIADLKKDTSVWAEETLTAMLSMSPTSLKLALRQIRQGASMNFAEVMTMEYRISLFCLQRPDFYEGVRAALIDKDRTPHWNPARIEDVSDTEIANCFQCTGDDLVFDTVPKASKTMNGFTLVELAITMVIIGLLIGGVLKGQQMIANARVTALTAQVQSYRAAHTTFRDVHQNLPGDMPNATTKLADCTAANNCYNGNGDTMVGSITVNYSHDNQGASIALPAVETTMYWKHLLDAKLITGVNAFSDPLVPAWGGTHPAAQIGGGFHVLFADESGTNQARGLYYMLRLLPIGDPHPTILGTAVLNAITARSIDTKIDDGNAREGEVRADTGTGSTCNVTGTGTYIVSTSKDCIMIFSVEK
jgi:enoyl-CoA hydratase